MTAFYTAILDYVETLVAGLSAGIARDAVEEEIARIRNHREQAILIRSR